jgi:molybdate/tungstate transport system substrate-binding protein
MNISVDKGFESAILITVARHRRLSRIIVMRYFRSIVTSAVLITEIFVLSSCEKREESAGPNDLVVFHAGSLSVPFKQISDIFEKENPGVNVLLEAAGSRTCARKISELGRPCDIMASADYSVIDDLLIPEHADWNIKFAGNEMVIAYIEGSKKALEIGRDNWHRILLDSGVAFGRSDPDSDPCGYRALLVVKLAEKYYGLEGLSQLVQQKDRQYIRPKETELLALLESHAIDYIFIYRSVAVQHGLKVLSLPDEINLGRVELADYYGTAAVEVSGREPGTTITKRGTPMAYGVTIPKNSPSPELAMAFIRFLLDESKGLAVMEKNGQHSIVPSRTDTYGKLPDEFKRYALPADSGSPSTETRINNE